MTILVLEQHITRQQGRGSLFWTLVPFATALGILVGGCQPRFTIKDPASQGGSESASASGSTPSAVAGLPASETERLPGEAREAMRSLSSTGVKRVSLNGMTLSDAVGVAISRHPDISRAQAFVVQSSSEVSIAKSVWFPTLEYSVTPGYGSSFGSGGSNTGTRGSAGINQLVYDFGRTPNTIAAADAGLSRQRHLLAQTIESVAYTTATYFVEMAASQNTLAAAERQVADLRKTRDMIADRVKAGLSSASDLTQADVAVQRAIVDRVRSSTRIDVAAGNLAEILGVRPTRVADISAADRMIVALGARDGSIEHTPSVLASRAAVEAAEARVKLAKSDYFPSVSLSAGKSMSSGRKNAEDSGWVGLQLSGSFSTGGRAIYRVDSANAERLAADKELENQRLTARTTLTSAETEARGAGVRMDTYDTMKTLSRTSRDLYWQEYTLNKRPLTEVLNAERDIFLAESERIAAIADSIIARVKAHVAMGTLVTRLREREEKRL